MRWGRYWSQLIGAATLVLLLAPSAAFGLPSAQVVIEDPAPQSGVTEHSTVTVIGTGCSVGDEAVAAFNNQDVATTTAEADGSFTLTFTVPPVPERVDEVEEGRESSIRVSCSGDSGGVVVVWLDATLPVTGFGVTQVAFIGGLVLAIGVVILLVSNRGKTATLTRR